ncbi:MAG TPA: hypothetical protein VNR11_10820 [Xanthobacteraceae bacterium]|nr:hypothetical protein [Xanthobacteraceae bacterium]
MPNVDDRAGTAFATGRAARSLIARVAFGLAVFATLTVAIFAWMPKTLFDFDASHYTSIAYDLDRYAVFSNGLFDDVDSTLAEPPPGMFFGPVYPAIVAAAMQVDPRFKAAVECWVNADARKEDGTRQCERYATPMLVIHAVFLALGVMAIARTGELMFRSEWVFWAGGSLAALGLVFESELFSFVMTESVTFGLYAVFSLACVLAWRSQRPRDALVAGLALGVLILHRPSFQVLVPAGALLFLIAAWRKRPSLAFARRRVAAFAFGSLLVVAPWVARNYTVLDKFGLTEEYGAATIIERLAFNDMTAHEFVLAFPYCLPGIGPPLVDGIFGKQAMHRFTWYEPDSFFTVGRTRRGALVQAHGSLDAVVGTVLRHELGSGWPAHVLSSVPLGWCGLWAGGIAALLLAPAFVLALWRAARRGEMVFLLYAVPALTMLALHAALANHYTRYNLALIGPSAIGTAWVLAGVPRKLRRWLGRSVPAAAA